MKRFLSGFGSLLIGVLCFAGVILLFVGGAWVAAHVEPWIAFIAVTAILIGLPVCLLLLIFRKTRGWGGLGIYFLSWPLGLWVWVASFVYAISVSLFWTVIGIMMGGLGIIPIAAIMTLIRRDWPNFGGLVGTLAVVLGLRFLGLWIVTKAEEREQERAQIPVAGGIPTVGTPDEAAQELYEIAANEVDQHKEVRGIMAKAFSDAGGDEKKAVAFYIKYRVAQLAQEAREELRQKRRAGRDAAKQRTSRDFKQLLPTLLGVLTAIFGALAFGFMLVGVSELGNPQGDPLAPAGLALLSFLMAIGSGVCCYLAYRFIKKPPAKG